MHVVARNADVRMEQEEKMSDMVKDYCIHCDKFMIGFKRLKDMKSEKVKGEVIGCCFKEMDSWLCSHDYENKKKFTIYLGFSDFWTLSEGWSNFYLCPSAIVTESTLMHHVSVNAFEESKKVFLKKCDKMLENTPCPMKDDNDGCVLFVERSMRKWNSKTS